jgi:hypothetical protein
MVNDLLLAGKTPPIRFADSLAKTQIFYGAGFKRRTNCLKQLRTALLLAIWLEWVGEGKVAREQTISNLEFQISN